MSKRFLFSWILGAAIMYSAFYFWHGWVLNDFARADFPFSLFLIFAAITYLFISYLLNKVFEISFWDGISKNYFVKALFAGISVGFLLFIMTTVLGLSFNSRFDTMHFVTDLTWQLFEQTIGAVVIAFCHIHIYHPEVEESSRA